MVEEGRRKVLSEREWCFDIPINQRTLKCRQKNYFIHNEQLTRIVI